MIANPTMYNLDRQGSFLLPCVSTARPRRGDWKNHEVVKTTKLSLWYQSNRTLGSIGKPVTGYLCSLGHISPYWDSVASVWLPKALV